MALYLRKGSKNWWVSVYQPSQKRRTRFSTGTENKDEAATIEHTLRLACAGKTPRQRLHAAIDALLGPDPSAIPALPLSGIWEAYQQAARAAGQSTLAPVTARMREAACKRLAVWAGDHWPRAKAMQDVDRPCAFAFADSLLQSGAADKTRANVLGDLGTVWRTLMTRTGITENVWALTKPRAIHGQHGRAFTVDEETRLLATAQTIGHDWHPVCLVARYTGLRYGDIARLKWDKIDLTAGRIKLRPSKTARHGIELGLPIHPSLTTLLTDRPRDPSGFVFPSHAAEYDDHQRGQNPFKDVLIAAKIPMDTEGLVTFHSWRHTFRTRLSEAGVSQELAMALGGWTQASTAGMYSHDWSALDKAVKSMR